MKLLYLEPVYSDIWAEHFQNLLNAHKLPETVVDVAHLENPAQEETPYMLQKPYYFKDLFETISRAEEDGYDAVMVGCAADPGVREARYMAGIPVIGPLQAGLHTAGLLGRKVCILCTAHDGKRPKHRPLHWFEDCLHFYGIDRERVCFRLVDVVRTDRAKNNRFVENKMWSELREELSAQFHRSVLEHGIDQAEKAVSEDGADVVFFACTLFGGKLGPVAEALDVPVLDPVITMLKATEMSVKSKLLCGHEMGAGVV